MNHVQEAQTKLKRNIEQKLWKSQEKDVAMIEELQEEISQLQRKHSELEELLQSDDHLHLLQVSHHCFLLFKMRRKGERYKDGSRQYFYIWCSKRWGINLRVMTAEDIYKKGDIRYT